MTHDAFFVQKIFWAPILYDFWIFSQFLREFRMDFIVKTQKQFKFELFYPLEIGGRLSLNNFSHLATLSISTAEPIAS